MNCGFLIVRAAGEQSGDSQVTSGDGRATVGSRSAPAFGHGHRRRAQNIRRDGEPSSCFSLQGLRRPARPVRVCCTSD